MEHHAGKSFVDFFGENILLWDLCNADVKLDDLLIHKGPTYEWKKFSCKLFNADKTFYILKESFASNLILLNTLVTPGELVLYDRNNHK